MALVFVFFQASLRTTWTKTRAYPSTTGSASSAASSAPSRSPLLTKLLTDGWYRFIRHLVDCNLRCIGPVECNSGAEFGKRAYTVIHLLQVVLNLFVLCWPSEQVLKGYRQNWVCLAVGQVDRELWVSISIRSHLRAVAKEINYLGRQLPRKTTHGPCK